MINILVADDYPAVRQVISTYFDYHSRYVKVIAQAGTGKEVLDLVENIRLDAILIDILLPEMNGLEVIRKIRETNSYILIIAFSGDKYSNYEEKSLEAGADYFIPKPYDLVDLEEMIIKDRDYQPSYNDFYLI
ncbi:MAG: response regulator [bacterium]